MISKLQNRSIINYFDRNKFLIKIVQLIMTTIISVNCICINAYAVQNVNTNEKIDITSPSAILVEASTGTVIYEKNSDEVRSPASITKIMTLLLIFDAIKSPSCPAMLNTMLIAKYTNNTIKTLSDLQINHVTGVYLFKNKNIVPNTAPNTVPAIAPSTLFLGLIVGQSLCFPNLIPNK